MVHVELTDVDRLKVTVLAIIFLMNCVRVGVLVDGFLVDSLTLVASTEGCCFRISKFNFGRATD